MSVERFSDKHLHCHARDERAAVTFRDEMPRALDPQIAAAIVRELKAIGYRYVTLDLQGYRTGSLNEGLMLRPA